MVEAGRAKELSGGGAIAHRVDEIEGEISTAQIEM
jgi:hypothetical protein